MKNTFQKTLLTKTVYISLVFLLIFLTNVAVSSAAFTKVDGSDDVSYSKAVIIPDYTVTDTQRYDLPVIMKVSGGNVDHFKIEISYDASKVNVSSAGFSDKLLTFTDSFNMGTTWVDKGSSLSPGSIVIEGTAGLAQQIMETMEVGKISFSINSLDMGSSTDFIITSVDVNLEGFEKENGTITMGEEGPDFIPGDVASVGDNITQDRAKNGQLSLNPDQQVTSEDVDYLFWYMFYSDIPGFDNPVDIGTESNHDTDDDGDVDMVDVRYWYGEVNK